MQPDDIVICAAVRTPIGKFLGGLAKVSAIELGVVASKGALAAAGADAADVDQVLFGMGRQAGSGPNPARQIGIGAGVPDSSPAMTLNQACASGLRTITMAAREIRAGDARAILAGGVENMSGIPFLLPNFRFGYRLGDRPVLDGNFADGFTCPMVGGPMGGTAETLADQYEIGREEQDAFALESQRKAKAAMEAGLFKDEIVPVTVKGRKGDTVVDTDEHPRPDANAASMARLPPAFRKDGGTVTAANSSGVTDAAAATLVTTAAHAEAKGWPILARLVDDAMAGVSPHVMGIGPVPATQKLLEKTGVALGDIDLIELNEAFAAQVLACDRELSLDHSKLNVNGGAIALGHPIGCTGTRIVVTLLHEMRRRKAKTGLATLCVSGGMGIAALFERA